MYSYMGVFHFYLFIFLDAVVLPRASEVLWRPLLALKDPKVLGCYSRVQASHGATIQPVFALVCLGDLAFLGQTKDSEVLLEVVLPLEFEAPPGSTEGR